MVASILIIAGIIALDQLTKWLAITYLAPVGSMPFIPGLMELRYVLNDGMAFSMLAGARWLLIGVTTVALVAMGFWVCRSYKAKAKLEYFSLLMVIGGGIGNLIDRVLNGYVVDFFATTFIDFAVFNVADCFVVVGMFLLVAAVIYEEYAAKKSEKSEATPEDEGNVS